jgi:hypothetical protein
MFEIGNFSLTIEFILQTRITSCGQKMIDTVEEDDLAAWYRITQPVEDISIRDFELEDEDVLLEVPA